VDDVGALGQRYGVLEADLSVLLEDWATLSEEL